MDENNDFKLMYNRDYFSKVAKEHEDIEKSGRQEWTDVEIWNERISLKEMEKWTYREKTCVDQIPNSSKWWQKPIFNMELVD